MQHSCFLTPRIGANYTETYLASQLIRLHGTSPRKENQVVDFCLHSVRKHADDIFCLCEQGAQRYANTYVDRQVGKDEHFLVLRLH